ncbi:MAG: LysE family translocator [Dehalococcoidia bacterium]|nr:LysE family translocator [Dehalococcoidia bacterium]
MSAAALAAIFVTSFGVGFTGALMPGPLTTVAVRESMQRGFWAGPLLAAGHSLIELALVIGLALGLSRFLAEEPVKAGVGIAGGLFLLWMGVHIVTSRAEPPLVVERPSPPDGPGAAYDGSWRRRWLRSLAGGEAASRSIPRTAAVVMSAAILVSVLNPGWIAWWASVGSAFISQSLEQGAAGVASFYVGHILSDILWLTLLAFVLASGRRVMSGGVYRGVLVVCGLFLLGLGTYFLASGLVLIS